MGSRTASARASHLTDPDQAVEFVERTGIDALAVAIGTSHVRATEFTQPPTGEVLAMRLIEEIHRRLPGRISSCTAPPRCPKHLVDEINKYGGEIKPTWGVPVGRSSRGSATASARSTSIPTTVWR